MFADRKLRAQPNTPRFTHLADLGALRLKHSAAPNPILETNVTGDEGSPTHETTKHRLPCLTQTGEGPALYFSWYYFAVLRVLFWLLFSFSFFGISADFVQLLCFDAIDSDRQDAGHAFIRVLHSHPSSQANPSTPGCQCAPRHSSLSSPILFSLIVFWYHGHVGRPVSKLRPFSRN